MLLERYARENLGEEVGRIILGRDIGHGDKVRAAKLPHLEELTVDLWGATRGPAARGRPVRSPDRAKQGYTSRALQ